MAVMSLKVALFSLGIGVVALFSTLYPQSDPKEKETVILNAIMKVQQYAHFEDNVLDDAFSENVLSNYLERLDYGKRFLLQSDVSQLSSYRHLIDDHINQGNLEFFDLSVGMIEKGLDKVQSWYSDILNEPFDYSDSETYETYGEKRHFANSDEELKTNWKKQLKYETLVKLARKIENQEKKIEKGEEVEVKSVEELEVESREDVKETYDDWFDRLDDVRRSDRFEAFVNTITHAFDPHTDYYNPKRKEDFDINMSGRLEGIGARLQTDGDYTKVVDVIPGGPAWKQKELEIGDKISRVRQGDSEEVEDITGMRIDDVVKRIRGKKGTKVTLQVIKKDGSEEEITIERDEVIIDEGFAKSLIIDHDEMAESIGYIYLPRFYSNFNSANGPKASRDIKKELDKLKAENVGGIILDIRNNGGGALNEVVDMAGLFIESGPIVQVKNRTGEPFIYRDKDESVAYDGPLVVMVNSNSASASEILAAALQDYNRAIIVGSPSTFGKGTVQRFFDLDRAVTGAGDMKPLGQVKITTQKYFRINGGSVQLKGVIPDVILPDNYMYFETGEKDYDHAMEWTQIKPVDHSQDIFKVNGLSVLQSNSQTRVSSNEVFKKIEENARRIKQMKDESSYPLNIETYRDLTKQRKEASDKYKDLMQPIEAFNLRNSEVDMAYINTDSSRIARNDRWKENLQKDVYLEEALFILADVKANRHP
jgi:carboxyl-terminal processing protease